MSIKVNPPPQLRIPDQFFNNPDLRNFFEQQQIMLFQLWNRTGGANDTVADLESEELYDSGITDSSLIEVKKQLDELEPIENSATYLTVLEKRIQELELQVEMLVTTNTSNIEDHINDLQINMEMNYGV